MKNIIRIVLFIVFIFLMFIPGISASESKDIISIKLISKKSDNSIYFTININDIDKDISTLSILLDYDKDVLDMDLDSLEVNSDYISTKDVENPNKNGRITFGCLSNVFSKSNEVAKIKFNILDDTGDTTIKLRSDYVLTINDNYYTGIMLNSVILDLK